MIFYLFHSLPVSSSIFCIYVVIKSVFSYSTIYIYINIFVF